MAFTYDVEIADYNSAGIREIAAQIGATHMRQIAAGSLNGERGVLFALSCNGDEIRVLDTNADPVWEEEDAAAFAGTLEEYGIALEPDETVAQKAVNQFAVIDRDGFFGDTTKVYSAHDTKAEAVKAARHRSSMVTHSEGGFTEGQVIYADTIRRIFPVVW